MVAHEQLEQAGHEDTRDTAWDSLSEVPFNQSANMVGPMSLVE